MISHDYKCIFIHIPRTGGSSFEQVIVGKNWWSIDPSTKHILASQAKQMYADYWGDYFKFTVVRNPWDRCVSLLNFGLTYYGQSSNELTPGMIEWYKRKYGYPCTIEYDHRFYKREDVLQPQHAEHQVYGNILDEELDYVARFENLQDDFAEIKRLLGLKAQALPKKAASHERRPYEQYFDNDLRAVVAQLYKQDLDTYEYDFERRNRRF